MPGPAQGFVGTAAGWVFGLPPAALAHTDGHRCPTYGTTCEAGGRHWDHDLPSLSPLCHCWSPGWAGSCGCLWVLDFRPVKEEGGTARAPLPDPHGAVEEPLQQGPGLSVLSITKPRHRRSKTTSALLSGGLFIPCLTLGQWLFYC